MIYFLTFRLLSLLTCHLRADHRFELADLLSLTLYHHLQYRYLNPCELQLSFEPALRFYLWIVFALLPVTSSLLFQFLFDLDDLLELDRYFLE